MAEQQRQSLCPRLIDYLAIVGVRSNTIRSGNSGGGNAGGNGSCPSGSNNPPVQVKI